MIDATSIDHARLLSAGRVSPDARWRMDQHVHDHWELIYFLSGRGRIDTPNGSLEASRGSLAVYPPGLPHAESADPANPEETIFVAVQMDANPPTGVHILIPDRDGDMGWLCTRVLAESRDGRAAGLAEIYTRALLTLVDRAWDRGTTVPHSIVDTAVQFLHGSIDRAIQLTDVAAAARVSEGHLSHLFQRQIGVSPMRYLLRLRMDRAAQLLCSTDLPISQIAEKIGFTDPLYFSRAVRRELGASPTRLRKAARQQLSP